jgi:hypothetical protein
MAIRVEVFSKMGEGASSAVMNQIRAVINENRFDATVQLVTEPSLLAMNGIEETPAVFVDGLMISNGWAPSRMEILRALSQRVAALNPVKPDWE